MSRTTPSHTRTYKDDVITGLALEGELLPILQAHYNIPLSRQERYDHFDFVDESRRMFVELKGRRCCWGAYSTLWINLEKVNWAKEYLERFPDSEFYFVIQCIDELIHVKYDPAVFDTYRVGVYRRTDRDRADLAIPVVNVPVCHFTRIRPNGVRRTKTFPKH